MPNWCSVCYCIYGEDKQALDKMYDDFLFATSERDNYYSECWKNNWVGNLFIYTGLHTIDEIENSSIHCRGYIVWLNRLANGEIRLDMELAWNDNLNEMKELVSHYSDNLKIVCCAEENGCGYYINTDTEGKYFSDRYRVNLTIEDTHNYDTEYFSDLDSVKSYVAQEIGADINELSTIDDCVDKFNDYCDKHQYEGYLYIDTFENV